MKNQTDPNWLEGLQPEQLGTGLFLLPDVFSERYAAMIVAAVPQITYPQCVLRGMFAVAYKWVPERIASFEQLQEDVDCGDTMPCAGQCRRLGCMCNDATGLCVPLGNPTRRRGTRQG
ncbi:MAG: hypothetical protein M1546_24535 [Chloroflexi bacterium]|nr:hypothetical protein [Chloroflexota bacterium]